MASRRIVRCDMATWFDRERGNRSGRIESDVVSPPDGDNIFVLGSDRDDELATLSEGDYTQVSQVVDLSGYDMVGATMKTVGALIAARQPRAGFAAKSDELFSFNFDVGIDPVRNLVENGFNLNVAGTVQVATEDYSPDETYCRRVPEGAAQSKMVGVNTPQAFPVSLAEYTIQWWMNFDSSVYSVATGIAPVVIKLGHEGALGAGLIVELSPIAATHQWRVLLKHIVGSNTYSTVFPSFIIDQPAGWQMFTIRYSSALPTQADLFVDGVNVSSNLTSIPIPTQLQAGEEISFMSRDLVGDFDQVRMISRRLDDTEILDSYNECVDAPSAIPYKWIMQILIDDVVYAERRIKADEERTWTDFTAPARLLEGAHSVAFRLGFERLDDGIVDDSLYRITEDGVVRVTEDGNVRIV